MKLNKHITLLLTIALLMSSNIKASEECFEGTSRAIFKFNMENEKWNIKYKNIVSTENNYILYILIIITNKHNYHM